MSKLKSDSCWPLSITSLQRCETARQHERGTRVWRSRRGHYILCPARRGGYNARFWPRLRSHPELLSSSRSVQFLGRFETQIFAFFRLEQHLGRTFRKPLCRGCWIERLELENATRKKLKRYRAHGDYRSW